MLPAVSVAVTVNVLLPSLAVSSGVPFAIEPTQDSMPTSSAQAKSASTTAPTLKPPPSTGGATVIVGADASGA